MNAIDVVRCCSDDFCNIDFIKFAERKERKVSILSLDSFLLDSHTDCSQLVLLIDNESISDRAFVTTLKNKILKKSYLSKICLWKNSSANPEDNFVNLFDDFIFLPCCENELQLRLDRQQLVTNELAISLKDNTQLFMEFAPLKLRGESRIFIEVLKLIKQISKFDAPVLIEGETGTGKENTARAIHYLGRRQDNAFIPINCGAMPDNLIESELFGYEKGAFTDAKNKNTGILALANNGTLFLDEVDSLSPKAQATLLRFLQTGEYRPLGGKFLCKSDVRVIAATNVDLEAKVADSEFREDLFFRLNVFKLPIPPLRERKQDILFLARYLLKKYCDEYHVAPKLFHPETLEWLQKQHWPGNVRQLENTILRELLLNTHSKILAFGFDSLSQLSASQAMHRVESEEDNFICFQSAKSLAIASFEKEYISNILSITAGNISEAARISGKERRALGKLLKKYDIDKNRFYAENSPA